MRCIKLSITYNNILNLFEGLSGWYVLFSFLFKCSITIKIILSILLFRTWFIDRELLYKDKSSESLPKGRYNKVHPMTVTQNTVFEFSYDVHKKVGPFMEKYKETLTPASLSLYYYIACQFIQEMNDTNNGTENIKIQVSMNTCISITDSNEDGVRCYYITL